MIIGGGPFGIFNCLRSRTILLRDFIARGSVQFGCHFFVVPQRNGERKGTKGFNTLWDPARLVSWVVFWWLPKGVVASARFAQQNQNILLLLQSNRFCLSLFELGRVAGSKGSHFCFLRATSVFASFLTCKRKR
jgi:hypothetical protein